MIKIKNLKFFLILNFCFFSIFYFSNSTKSSIIFLIIDDLRPILSTYGDKLSITPNLDDIASNGFVFENVYAQQALCAPSRTSLLTSRRPDTLKLYDTHSYWRKHVGNFTSLPQYFKENGYHTISIGKVFHPGIVSNHNDDYPLSWSEKPFHAATEKFKFSRVCPSNSDKKLKMNLVCPVDVSKQPLGTLPDIEATKFAVDTLKKYNFSSKPLFMALGFHKPHIPLKYPEKYRQLYPLNKIKLAEFRSRPKNMPSVAWNPWLDLRKRDDIHALNLSFPFDKIDDDFQKLIKQSYYAALSYIDDLIGQVITTLKNQSVYEDIIIVVVGDHGWSLGEHGEWSKYNNFDVALKVPLLIKLPNKISKNLKIESKAVLAKKIKEPVEIVDIFPTLVDLAGLNSLSLCPQKNLEKTCTEGLSIKPLILHYLQTSKTFLHWKKMAFSQYPRPSVWPKKNSDQPKLKDIKIMGYSITNVSIRYTEWIRFEQFKVNWSHIYAKELYLDQNQNKNMAECEEMKPIVNFFSKALRNGWRKALPQYYREYR